MPQEEWAKYFLLLVRMPNSGLEETTQAFLRADLSREAHHWNQGNRCERNIVPDWNFDFDSWFRKPQYKSKPGPEFPKDERIWILINELKLFNNTLSLVAVNFSRTQVHIWPALPRQRYKAKSGGSESCPRHLRALHSSVGDSTGWIPPLLGSRTVWWHLVYRYPLLWKIC